MFTSNKKNKMKRNTKTKLISICIAYIIIIVVGLFSFTPYVIYKTYFSSQNVPHTIIEEKGYTSIEYIGDTYRDYKKGTIEREQVDYPRAVFIFSIPTVIALLLCYGVYKKDNPSFKLLNFFKKDASCETAKLLRKIGDLEKEKQTLETILSDCLLLDAPPCKPKYPDFHTLAFADEQSQKKAIFEYEDKLSLYVRYKTLKEYISLVHGKSAVEYGEDDPFGPSFVVKSTNICDAEIDELVNTEPLSEDERLQIFEEMSKTSKPKETFYLMEAADGALVRVPASKLDDWIAAQKKQRSE